MGPAPMKLHFNGPRGMEMTLRTKDNMMLYDILDALAKLAHKPLRAIRLELKGEPLPNDKMVREVRYETRKGCLGIRC